MVIYNEHLENLGLDPANAKFSKLKGLNKVVPVAVEVNAKGEMKKYPLYSPKEMSGFAIDIYYLLEIEDTTYQFKVAKDLMFGQYETAYGRLELNYGV